MIERVMQRFSYMPRLRFVSYGPYCFVALLLAVCLGCGGSGGVPVRGEVTYDGQPVDSGSITFQPADGAGRSTGATIENGRYAITGEASPLPGKYTVNIRAALKTGKQVKAGPPFPPGTMVEETRTINAPPQTIELAAGQAEELPFHLDKR